MLKKCGLGILRCIVVSLVFLITKPLPGQVVSKENGKAVIDTGVIKNWPQIEHCFISPNGLYIGYLVGQETDGKVTLVLQDTSGRWLKSYVGGTACTFLKDCQHVIFQVGRDLHIVSLGKSEDRVISVLALRYTKGESGEWLAYQDQDTSDGIIQINLTNWKEERLGKATNFEYDRRGNYLLLTKTIRSDSTLNAELQLMDLAKDDTRRIWVGKVGQKPGPVAFDRSGRQAAFIVTWKGATRTVSSLWYYRMGSSGAEERVAADDSRIPNSTVITGRPTFSGNGQWLFFYLKNQILTEPRKGSGDLVKVDVWSYKDVDVQPDQITHDKEIRRMTAVLSVNGNGLRLLTKGEESLEVP